jgi:hypothetical protein
VLNLSFTTIESQFESLNLKAMKMINLMTFLSVSLSSCLFVGTSHTSTVTADERPGITYDDFLKTVNTERANLKSKPLADSKEYFFQLINHKIPAYWSGTPWDFNGVTRKPGEGKIACGYFITNTLTDLGFTIERVKLAQAASSVLIKATCTNIKYCAGFEGLKTYLAGQPEHSVFIVGLDFHTGYITKEKKDCYFIHSNYINSKGVTKEKIDISEALQASKTFMIGSISSNDELIKGWVGK